MKRFLFSSLMLLVVVLPLSAGYAEQRFTLPLDGSPSLGPENAPVTIIEFIDFQ